MQLYTADQVKTIRKAVGAARRAMSAHACFSPLDFARVFIEHDGVQIPAQPEAAQHAARVASALLQRLKVDVHTHSDPHVRRELHRARVESQWAALARDERVVGIRVVLGADSHALSVCRMALEQDFGLGAGVFPCSRILVLPPACQDYAIESVSAHDIEQ